MKSDNSQMKSERTHIIYPDKIVLSPSYFTEKGGVLNALAAASAQYIYRVIENHCKKNGIQIVRAFEEKKSKLRRCIVHKDPHLDEYFAELLFRALLPPYLKDVEIREHTLISRENDIFAKTSWPNGVVFGINALDAGGACALHTFDEHDRDGTRPKPSCSQLVADEYLSDCIPASIQEVLNEVNFNDANRGAHQFHLAHVVKDMHDVLFNLGFDITTKDEINKYLNEPWKRAIVDACIVSMIFCYENNYKEQILNKPYVLMNATMDSLNYFINHNVIQSLENYEEAKDYLINNLNNISPIVTAKWKFDGKKIDQLLLIQRVCYSLKICWGEEISKFVMMHIWQIYFQKQIYFTSIKREFYNHFTVNNTHQIRGDFGTINRYLIKDLNIKPEPSGKRTIFQDKSLLWVVFAEITNPLYFNIKAAISSYINDEYSKYGNNGFGLLIVHDKIINSILVNKGATFPYDSWVALSDRLVASEPDCWFQSKDSKNRYSDFVLNRTNAHQEQLPSSLFNFSFLQRILSDL